MTVCITKYDLSENTTCPTKYDLSFKLAHKVIFKDLLHSNTLVITILRQKISVLKKGLVKKIGLVEIFELSRNTTRQKRV